MAILRHVSKHDEIIQSHLYNTEPNSRIKYTSPDIKIIKISGEMVGERVMTLNTVITRSPAISPLILIILSHYTLTYHFTANFDYLDIWQFCII